MKLLERWEIDHGGQTRVVELLSGDLARLPAEHAVDVLVVSAYKQDYLETPTSLIGALARRGLSVSALARDKQVDLREQFSCWLSRPLPASFHFRHVLCVESGWRGAPPENVQDLFRALAPFLLTDFKDQAVAMPLIGAGDQGYASTAMLEAIVEAAISWIKRGLQLRTLKIVVHNPDAGGGIFTSAFRKIRQQNDQRPKLAGSNIEKHDVFVSYPHSDSTIVHMIVDTLTASSLRPRVFVDWHGLRSGTIWAIELARALDASKRVLAILSDAYWQSPMCQLEFSAALARQQDTGQHVLAPMRLEPFDMPYLFRGIQFEDCSVRDESKVVAACKRLLADLSSS